MATAIHHYKHYYHNIFSYNLFFGVGNMSTLNPNQTQILKTQTIQNITKYFSLYSSPHNPFGVRIWVGIDLIFMIILKTWLGMLMLKRL